MKRTKFLLHVLALVACLMCALGASAAESYACYTPSNTTLTFYYDDLRSSRSGTTYDLYSTTKLPGWYSDGTCANVTKVVFDPSFASARRTVTFFWFCDMTKLTSITGMKEYLNTSAVTSMGDMFYNCSGLTSLDLSGFNTAKVTDMTGAFYGCRGLTSLDLSRFNTANVTNMFNLFYGCSGLKTIYVGSGWSTEAVTRSTNMFNGCTSLVGGMGTTYNDSNPKDKTYAHIDGGTANPGYLTEFKEPYACYTSSNTTLTFYYDGQRTSRTGTTYDLNTGSGYPAWDWDGTKSSVTKVVFNYSFASARPTTTCGWFFGMSKLTSITGMKQYLNTSEVTNMYAMFQGCSSLTSLDLGSFNTAKVTDMRYMFYDCSALTTLDVSGFNTANVTSMDEMFTFCSSLTSLDVSSFNTSNVIDMGYMFSQCNALTNLDLSGFNTSKVTRMYSMFSGCKALTRLDLSSFNTSKVAYMTDMFYGCSGLKTIYVGSDWSTAAVTTSSEMFYDCTSLVGGMGTTYDANHMDKAYAHIDGGPSNPGYLTEFKEAYACYTPSNTTLTFYYDGQRTSRTGTTYDLNTGNNLPAWNTDGTKSNVTKVVFDSSFASARPTTTYGWFRDMTKLTTITGMKQYLNTSEVTNMGYMFYDCYKLTSLDVSNFNTANVTNMNSMFSDCSSLTSLDVSGFNTSKVTDMSDMFYFCSKLTSLDLSNFNTSNVTKMLSMFSGCRALTSLDVSRFNTSKVTNMSYMFNLCSSLTSLDVSGFNTAKVTDMSDMFYNCSGLTSLDLSGFNTSKVTYMTSMFYYCPNLKTIYAGSDWSTAAVTSSSNMFYGCSSLVGGKGTTYNDSNPRDKAYAHIDGGPSNPGYFTDKNASLRGDVNGNGIVTISDVTDLIDYLLSGNASGIDLDAADCNFDGIVTINDVTDLIDFLLAGHW